MSLEARVKAAEVEVAERETKLRAAENVLANRQAAVRAIELRQREASSRAEVREAELRETASQVERDQARLIRERQVRPAAVPGNHLWPQCPVPPGHAVTLNVLHCTGA